MTENAQQQGPQLCMERPNLDNLAGIELAEGYTIRTSQKGDAQHWARIISEAFADDSFDESRFEREMRVHDAYRPERIFFACAPDGLPCGTASAYRQEAFGPDTGYLHYVGVCLSHRGKRIGTAVSLAALNKFRSESLRRAVLQTDDFRLPAIKTYLNLGFSPLIMHKSHPKRWNAVFVKLGLPISGP